MLTIVIIMTIMCSEVLIMSKRVFFFVSGITALILGGLLYVLFRENTYIARHMAYAFSLDKVRAGLKFLNCGFIRYYLPDYLWGFSLCSIFFAIYSPDILKEVFIAISIFAYGLIWELMQFYKVVSGTGDLVDVFMYLLAVVTVVIINHVKGKLK